jgi:hypothetical protein
VRLDGDPHWDHDDECSLLNLCAQCLAEQERRDEEEAEANARGVLGMPRSASHPTFVSVTECLAAVGLTREYRGVDPKYALLGQALHETLHWHALGILDESSIHEEVRPGFTAYLDFLAQTDHVVIASEVELVDEHYGIVGHADRVGSIDSEPCALIDFKYSDNPDLKGARYQIAAYTWLWNRSHPEQPVTRGYVIQLTKAGRYKPIEVTDAYAGQVFVAALTVFRARESER